MSYVFAFAFAAVVIGSSPYPLTSFVLVLVGLALGNASRGGDLDV